jgi:hypothetical protein
MPGGPPSQETLERKRSERDARVSEGNKKRDAIAKAAWEQELKNINEKRQRQGCRELDQPPSKSAVHDEKTCDQDLCVFVFKINDYLKNKDRQGAINKLTRCIASRNKANNPPDALHTSIIEKLEALLADITSGKEGLVKLDENQPIYPSRYGHVNSITLVAGRRKTARRRRRRLTHRSKS